MITDGFGFHWGTATYWSRDELVIEFDRFICVNKSQDWNLPTHVEAMSQEDAEWYEAQVVDDMTWRFDSYLGPVNQKAFMKDLVQFAKNRGLDIEQIVPHLIDTDAQ